MRQRKGLNHAAWRDLIEEHSAGDQTIAAFCLARGVKDHSFYWHRRRMQRAGSEAGFREVALPVGAAIRVVVPGAGSHIEVERGFDAQCLREVVQAFR